MVRYTLDQGPIQVAYGFDHVTGHFLSVVDERLIYQPDAPDDVNDLVNGLWLGDGGGGFFDVQTNSMGFGKQVSLTVILTLWKRYGVPEAHIKLAKEGKMGM